MGATYKVEAKPSDPALGFGAEAEGRIGGLGFNLMGCAHYDCCALISRFRLNIEVLVYLGRLS